MVQKLKHSSGIVKWCTYYGEQFGISSKNLNIESLLLVIYMGSPVAQKFDPWVGKISWRK